MGLDERVLEDCSPGVTTRDVVANLELRSELPLPLAVKGRDGDTTGNVDGSRDVGDVFQGSLDTIVNAVEKTRSELDR